MIRAQPHLKIIKNYCGIFFLFKFNFRSITSPTIMRLMVLDVTIDNENIDVAPTRNQDQRARYSSLIQQYCRANPEWNDT